MRCEYCRRTSPSGTLNCPSCGAPLPTMPVLPVETRTVIDRVLFSHSTLGITTTISLNWVAKTGKFKPELVQIREITKVSTLGGILILHANNKTHRYAFGDAIGAAKRAIDAALLALS